MEPADLAAAWMRMCSSGDMAMFAKLTAAAFACHGPGGTGTAADFLNWLAWYPTAFAGQQARVNDVFAAGDRVAFRYTVISTYRGGFLGLPADGHQVREEGIVIFRLDGGRVAELWYQGNDLQIARQLGGHVTASAGQSPSVTTRNMA